jgi:hypothetical protein
VKWEQPKDGYIKLNWDATINRTTRRMGAGVVAQDENGLVVAAMSASRPCISDLATAKAIAVVQKVTNLSRT